VIRSRNLIKILRGSRISRKLLRRTKNPMMQRTNKKRIKIRDSLRKLKLCGLGKRINLIIYPLEVEKEVLRIIALQIYDYGV
jgi:hypothetical protein